MLRFCDFSRSAIRETELIVCDAKLRVGLDCLLISTQRFLQRSSRGNHQAELHVSFSESRINCHGLLEQRFHSLQHCTALRFPRSFPKHQSVVVVRLRVSRLLFRESCQLFLAARKRLCRSLLHLAKQQIRLRIEGLQIRRFTNPSRGFSILSVRIIRRA